jgi:20S proteasome alpha/beta subunit
MNRGSTDATIITVTCADRVLLAADSRTPFTTKAALRDLSRITRLTPNIYLCHSGTLSSTQVVNRMTRYYDDSRAIWITDSAPPRVSAAVEVLRKILESSKEDLSSQLIVGGIDNNGSHVYAGTQSELAIEREFATTGSGSASHRTYINENYRPGMTVDQAEESAWTAITFAALRDGTFGGAIQIAKVRKNNDSVKWYRLDRQPIDVSDVKT